MPTDFKGISTTRGRRYWPENISFLNDRLSEIPIEQRAAILGSIIEESGGDPYATSDTGAYQGLLQWGADRYRPQSSNPKTELSNQAQYILDTKDNTTDKVSWTHGGKGSGYNTARETHEAFNSKDNTFADKFRAFSYGYVRPQGKEDSYQNRLKVGKKVLNKLVVDEVLSRPEPTRVPKYDFDSYVFKPKNKYSEGGYMDDLWNSLSMKEKAEMMKVAIANGITSLPEIRQAYNKFAKGGRMNGWTMQDEAGYRYWRQNLPRNLRETNDNDYDMRAAYKAGMQPKWDEEDKSYHLGSRDPESGKILKSPHHSTFLKALVEDARLGYYPTMDSNGKVYTETWEGNKYGDGGYAPSESIKKRITNWEGESMKTNRSFAAEAKDFNATVPAEVRSKLSSQQLDALFSYGYNVGMGNLKRRVLPALTAYTEGKASKEDVQRSMWAAKDNELRGLTTRRNAEREMFGGNYRTAFTGTGKLGLHLDPKEFTYYEDLTPMIDNINIPQLQSAADDPELRYKAPTIDMTLFQQPQETKAMEPVYTPQEDRLEGLRNFNTVMGLMGQQSPFAALGNNDNAGLLSYIGQIYS